MTESRTDIVLDIETLHNEPEAKPVVLSIGAVALNLDGEDTYDSLLNHSFYHVLDPAPQKKVGHTEGEDTVNWWSKQDPTARAAVFNVPLSHPEEVTKAFAEWMNGYRATHLWGNGAVFDNVITRILFRSFGVEFPIKFWNDMDLRTIMRLNGGKPDVAFTGCKHHALDDAIHEALMLQAARRNLRAGAPAPMAGRFKKRA